MGLPLINTRITEEAPQPESGLMADRVPISDARADSVPVSLPDTDQLRRTEQPALESTGSINETGEVRTYIIPQRRPRGTHGLLPRSTNDSDTESEHSGARPVRVKRRPGWMNPNEWVLSQPHTFVVNGREVTHL